MIPNSYSLKEIHTLSCMKTYPDSKVHGANMGPTWVLSAPDEPHVGPMNLAISVSPQLSWLLYNPPSQQPLTQVYWHYNTYLQLSFFHPPGTQFASVLAILIVLGRPTGRLWLQMRCSVVMI